MVMAAFEYLSEFVKKVVLNYIETGKFSSEFTKEAMIAKLINMHKDEQVASVAEITTHLRQENSITSAPGSLFELLNKTTSDPIELRAIEILDCFAQEVIGEVDYDFDYDVQLTLAYINTGNNFSASYYQTVEKFREKISGYEYDMQVDFIGNIKVNLREKCSYSLSGYVLSFFTTTTNDLIEQRTVEVLKFFDPEALRFYEWRSERFGTGPRQSNSCVIL